MSVIYWVRHGPTHTKTIVGHRDIPADLSDIDQIARLDAYLPSDALLVSSDLSRAITTADAIQTGRNRLPHLKSLREIDFGLWDGMSFTQVAAHWPELSRAFWETPGDISAPHGESWNSAAMRINRAVEQLIQKYLGRPLIIVAHFGAILTQVQRAASCSAYDALAYKIDNYSVTTIQYQPSWSIHQVNHMP